MKRVFTPEKKKTILIVDDDQVAVHIYRDTLQRHGFKVEVTENGDSALQKMKREPVVLMIFDLCLPEINGVEVLKEIRAEFDAQVLPIIAFFNPYLGSLERAALESGASKCMAKANATPNQVLEFVRELLGPTPENVGVESGKEIQEQLIASVLNGASQIVANLRASHQAFAKAQEDDSRQSELRNMHLQLRALFGSAGLLGFHKIAQMVHALEALFIELVTKPQKITASVTRTIAQAIDTLASLLDDAGREQDETSASPKIAVVDDEIISRETICSALGKANLAAISMDDPLAAQRLLEQEHFDLIFLDMEMPGITGLQLCVKVREMNTNSSTPVVFVTSHSDFGSRAQSTLSGGNDFIAKPFLLVELAVKALTWLFKKNPPPVATTTVPENATVQTDQSDHAALSIHEG